MLPKVAVAFAAAQKKHSSKSLKAAADEVSTGLPHSRTTVEVVAGSDSSEVTDAPSTVSVEAATASSTSISTVHESVAAPVTSVPATSAPDTNVTVTSVITSQPFESLPTVGDHTSPSQQQQQEQGSTLEQTPQQADSPHLAAVKGEEAEMVLETTQSWLEFPPITEPRMTELGRV